MRHDTCRVEVNLRIQYIFVTATFSNLIIIVITVIIIVCHLDHHHRQCQTYPHHHYWHVFGVQVGARCAPSGKVLRDSLNPNTGTGATTTASQSLPQSTSHRHIYRHLQHHRQRLCRVPNHTCWRLSLCSWYWCSSSGSCWCWCWRRQCC